MHISFDCGIEQDIPGERSRDGARLLCRYGAASLAWTVVALGMSHSAWAAEESKSGPKTIYVGVYVKQIHGISLKDSQAVVDFHLWFRWTDDDLHPLDTFDLVNGSIESKLNVYQATTQGVHYASCRLRATLHKLWDVSRYPLDSHIVSIEIEDNDLEADKLVFLADTDNSGLSSNAELAGWSLKAGDAAVVTNTDRTNYGDISLPTGHESSWSRFTYSVEVARPGPGIFIKLFTGLFIATAIALQALRIPAALIDARLGLSVGAIFASVASEYLVAAGLPESNGLTLADKLHILSFGFIFLSLAESIVVYKFVVNGKGASAARIDRLCFPFLATTYVVLVATFAIS